MTREDEILDVNDALYFLKRNNLLMIRAQSKDCATGVSTQDKHSSKSHLIKRIPGLIKKLTQLVSLFFKMFFIRRGSTFFFDHSTRLVLDEERKVPLYSTRILEARDDVVCFFNSSEKEVSFPSCSNVIVTTPLEPLMGKLQKFFWGRLPGYLGDYKVRKFIWKFWFRLLRPRSVYLVVWYCGKENLVAAAKDLGIPVFELQHGFVSEEHPWYKMSGEVNATNEYLLPTALLTYGSYWDELLIQAGYPKDRIRTFGYYVFIPEYRRPEDLPEKYILISSQPIFAEVLAKAALQLKEAIYPDLPVVVAAHPSGDYPEIYSRILGDQVLVIHRRSYELLMYCTANVGATSTLIWEGVFFGKKTNLVRAPSLTPCHHRFLLKHGIAKEFGSDLTPNFFEEPLDRNIVTHYFKTPDFKSL
jgi:hypothetical protein